jgi:hypothetical protein
MPYWVEFNKMRSGKDMDLFDDFNTFKKMKDYRSSSAKRPTSAANNDDLTNDDQSV